MQATGVVDQKLQQLVGKQTKSKDQALATDPIWQEKSLNDSLRGNTEAFVKVFGFEGVQHARFDASAGQALFLRNGALLQSWVALKNGLSDRLVALENDEVAEEFYLSVFSRMPSGEEANLIVDLLGDGDTRKATIQQLVWAGLVSTEFRFNN